MNEFDVVVVGAGTAGSSFAEYVAHRGFSVALVDRKTEAQIGDKVCGDAISHRHFEVTGFKPPEPRDTVNRVNGIRIFPPSLETYYTLTSFYGNGYVVDRHRDGQTRMRRAVREGAELFDNCLAKNLLLDAGFAAGARVVQMKGEGRSKREKEELDIKAKVTVDASGWQGVLYRDAPDEWGMDKGMGVGERIDSSRDIVEVQDPEADGAVALDPDNLDIIMTQRFGPGGYVWRFPAREDARIVNVGNGVAVRPGAPKSRALLEEYYRFDPVFHGFRRIKSATWPIPSRRPRGKLVGNGFAALGDAAIQINPATAEGIGYGIGAAWYLGEVVCGVLEGGGRPTEESLWGYAHAYMASPEYGLRQAKFDVFRILLQSSSDRDYNGAFAHGLIREEELQRASEEEVELGLLDKFRRGVVAAATGHFTLLRRLDRCLRMMRQVQGLYRGYPETPDRYGEWKEREELFFRRVQHRLTPS